MSRATILLADDEETLRENLAQVLAEEGFEVIACRDGDRALKTLRSREIDAIITDLRMPGVSGVDLIDHAAKRAPDAPVIVITAFGEVETAVEVMKKGACDYITKPVIFDELIYKLKRMLAQDRLAKQNRRLQAEIRHRYDDANIVAVSPSMRTVIETIKRIAHTTSNVLISGESGTGKEVLARALHYAGITHEKPFVAVNCGGLTETLVESELFGYRRGAFTGADQDRIGYFQAADGGTLFLDEIGNLPLVSQAVLLRAIEEKAVTRVGDNQLHPVNIRIVAATNRALEQAVEAGGFREDLYYRLNVIHITVPPLRERLEDVPPLIEHFVRKYNAELNSGCPGFTPQATKVMCEQTWRGNVRELENVVERSLIFADGKAVDVQDLFFLLGTNVATPSRALDLRGATRDFERRHILKTLANCDNDKATAARVLGIGLSSLYRKMEELSIAKNLPATARTK